MSKTYNHKRIGYIDALRGFAIIMIVFMHVEHFSFGITYDKSVWGSIIISFFLPTFFFISGFLAKGKKQLGSISLSKEIWKKAKYLIIPALSFYALYYCINKEEDFFLLFTKGPRCYWFTVALFYIFTIYYVIQFLTQKLSPTASETLLFSISIGGLILYIGGTKFYHLDICPILCLTNVCRYFWYFIIGHFCRSHYSTFTKVISHEIVKAVCIFLFIISFITSWNKSAIQYSFIHIWLSEYLLWDLGTMVVIICFYHYRDYFESIKKIPHALCFIGRRTFDIYLIHWFFITKFNYLFQEKWIGITPNNILELSLVILFTVVIVSLCLFVSASIRTSRILGLYFLGAKDHNQ